MPQLALAFAAALLLAFIVGIHGTVERALFTSAFHGVSGGSVDAESFGFDTGGVTAKNLVLKERSGAATLSAKQARIDFELGSYLPGTHEKRMHITAADASLAPAGSARTLSLQSVDVTLHSAQSHRTGEMKAEIVDGAVRYPIAGNATEDGGTITYNWSAAALPLAPLLDLWAPADVVPKGGILRSVGAHAIVESGRAPHLYAHASLEGGEIALGSPDRALANLHGDILIDGTAGGSSLLSGTLDGAPLQLVGQLEAKDAGHFEQLLSNIAAEANLRDARIEAVASGVVFAKYHLESPNGKLAIHVASVDPFDPRISMDTVLAGDHITSGGERTSTMGQRTGAVLGVDGDYFDIGGSYAPQGIVIRSGTLLRSPTKRMAMTVHRGNRVTFDEYGFFGTLTTLKAKIPIATFNDFPPGKVSVITPEFGKLRPAAGVTFVALAPLAGSAYRYRVTSVGPITATQPAEFGLAFGHWAQHKPPRVGETVGLEYGTDPPYDDVVTAIGGGPLLIKDGLWYEDPDAPAKDERDVRWPVVGVGRLADASLLFMEVDGRWPDISVGMTRPEFGELMQRYHVVDGMALDSGGSAVIVSRVPGENEVSVRSHPSDQSYERYVTDALFVYSR